MALLRTKFRNMCLFVLTNSGAQAWFIEDQRHSPVLKVKDSTIVAPELGDEFSLVNWEVRFEIEGAAKDVTRLGGPYSSYLANLEQILPGVRLKSGWSPNQSTFPPGMTTRVHMTGGTLRALELATTGGAKSWQIGEKVAQRLTEDVFWELNFNGASRIVLVNVKTGETRSFETGPAGADHTILIESKEGAVPKLPKEHGVVFLDEFLGFEKALDLPFGLEMPVPFAYWPDYDHQTDPLGGPCPGGLVDLQTSDSLLPPP